MALPDAAEIVTLLKRADREVYQTKIVVRRLPPFLTSQELLDRLSPLPEYDYFYLAKPDLSLGAQAFSRAYFNFKRFDDVIEFRNRFDGFVFQDQGGRKYPTVVEFAPLQKIPHQKKTKDPKCGTIESDKDYKAFIKSLEAEAPSVPTAEARLEEIEARKQQASETTPLVEFLRRKHQSVKSSSKYASSAKTDTSRLRDKRKKDDSAKLSDKKTQSETKPTGTKKDTKSKLSETIGSSDQRITSSKPAKKGPTKQDERRDVKSRQERRSSRPESKKSHWLEEEEASSPSKPKSSGGFVTHEQDWPSLAQTKSNDVSPHGRPASARSEDTGKQPADTSTRSRGKQPETRKARSHPSQEVYVPRSARLAQESRQNEEERQSKPRGQGRGGQAQRHSGPNG